MTYLAQIKLDFASAARLQLRDCYDWHQAVWKAFPRRNGVSRDFLTRLDQEQGSFRLLIVSAVEPMRPEWCSPECWHGVKKIGDDYFAFNRYRFQLCANPTRKVAVQSVDGKFKKNGRRVPLSDREDLLEWINRKGEQGGFTVDAETLKTFGRGREYFRKKGVPGVHSAVEFQGVLSVTDRNKFRETFEQGVGSAKAFGFGLLVILPA